MGDWYELKQARKTYYKQGQKILKVRLGEVRYDGANTLKDEDS